MIGASPAAYAVRAAVDVLDPRQRSILERLRDAAPERIAVLGDLYDDISSLLATLGIGHRRIASEDLAEADVMVVFAGCPHRHTRLDLEDARRFLERGGVLVSSCRAAQLPGVAGHLPFDKPRGPRRARISDPDGQTADGQILYPAVALDHGHIPLAHQVDDYRDTTVLARDVLDDRPAVVVASLGRGALVHSVAHWWQDNDAAMTDLERRPLTGVRHLTPLANSHPDLTWGGFRAAQVMLEALLDGIDMGLGRAMQGAGADGVYREED